MKYKCLFIFLILFELPNLNAQKNVSRFSVPATGKWQELKEKEYIYIRNTYVENYKKLMKSGNKDSLRILEQKAYCDLEKRLREILFDSNFSINGKNNMNSFFEYVVFGGIDGLVIEEDSLKVFYTTKNLLFEYFGNDRLNLINDLTTRDLERIFTHTFITDANVLSLYNLKLKSSKELNEYGMIAGATNGIVRILPNFLFVLVSKGNYIYMAMREIEQPFSEIAKCKALWDNISRDTEKKIKENETLNSSNPYIDKNGKDLWIEAMHEYCNCYQLEFESNNQFSELLSKIMNMLKYLQN